MSSSVRAQRGGTGDAPPPRPLTPAEHRELTQLACRAGTRINQENFPVAARVLPRRHRDDLARVYCFARFVDEIGDSAAGDRLALLDAVAADVAALPGGEAELEPVRGLSALVQDGTLSTRPMLDLIEANRRDQYIARYETFDDLLGYCALSAAPVGRIVLALAGVQDSVAQERSDRVCAALQILEHCQDVGEDARAGRVYLPQAELRAAGVGDGELLGRHTSSRLRAVVAELVHRSQAMLADGVPLARSLRGWPRLAVTGYVAGGRATAAALRRADYDVLSTTIRPGKLAILGAAVQVGMGR